MPTTIYDGTFAGPTTAGAAGSTTGASDIAAVGTAGAWHDKAGGKYYVDSSNVLRVDGPYAFATDWLTRPDGEAVRDLAMRQDIAFGGPTIALGFLLRRSGNAAHWVSVRVNSGEIAASAYTVGDSFGSTYGDTASAQSIASGHRIAVKVEAEGANPTAFRVSYADLDGGSPGTYIQTHTWATSGGPQGAGTAGLDGWDAFGLPAVKRVIISDLAGAGTDPDPDPPGDLAMGPLSVTARTATSIAVGWSAATGGAGGTSYALYRSATAPFTPPGSGTLVGTTSGASLADNSPGSGVRFYRAVATDSASATATSSQGAGYPALMARILDPPVVLGLVGDSITAMQDTPSTLVASLASALPTRSVTFGVNRGASGTTSADWLPGGTLLGPAVAACVEAGTTDVGFMLGANDAKLGVATPASTYAANLAATAGPFVSAGIRVHLHSPMSVSAGGEWGQSSNVLLDAYRAAIPAICDGTTIVRGDDRLFDAIAASPSTFLSDGVHPNGTGSALIQECWASGFLQGLRGVSADAVFPAPDKVASGEAYGPNGDDYTGTADFSGSPADPFAPGRVFTFTRVVQ